MKRTLAVIALLVLALPALAQQDYPKDITLSWTNPSQYVDGTLIEPGDLTGVKLNCYRQNDTVPVISAIIPANGEGLAQSEVFTAAIPNPGTYRCEGFAIVIGDIYSDASDPAFKKYVGKPKAITLLKFES